MKTFNYLLMFLAALICTPAFAEVNINTADAKQIAAGLSNIGLSKAKAIVSYRKKNGPFQNADDLAKVQGIGNATVERNRHLISAGNTPQSPSKGGKQQGVKAKKPDCMDKSPS